MIEIITSPVGWVSAYEQNKYEFNYLVDFGSLTVYNLGANTPTQIDTFSAPLAAQFKVGDLLRIIQFSPLYFESTITNISGAVITLSEVRTTGLAATLMNVTKVVSDKIKLSLYVAQLDLGIGFTKLVDIYAIYRDGKHVVDVRGYLQDYFRDIKVPPVTGIDKELFCNYKLCLADTPLLILGSIVNSAYSTVKGLNTSNYVTAGAAMRIGNIEVFNSKQSIYSRINGGSIENLLIT